ncbi:MAG: hypothetical protein GX752_09365 [Clostridium sp.]|nr:hypothetical protein [Clostridium sp.]
MTNNQAIGYMLLACKNAEIPLEDLQKLYSNMSYLFDIKTEGEAEEQGFDWYLEVLDKEKQKKTL